MRKIRIIRACFVKGEHAEVGTEHDLGDADANNLIASGKGVPVGSGEPAIENREASADNRDPVPATKRARARQPDAPPAAPEAPAPSADPAAETP